MVPVSNCHTQMSPKLASRISAAAYPRCCAHSTSEIPQEPETVTLTPSGVRKVAVFACGGFQCAAVTAKCGATATASGPHDREGSTQQKNFGAKGAEARGAPEASKHWSPVATAAVMPLCTVVDVSRVCKAASRASLTAARAVPGTSAR